MPARIRQLPRQHGTGEVRVSRYLALYVTQIGWLAVGLFLFRHAVWPSACTPDRLLEVVTCSVELPKNRGWIESALMTWLWSTPLLVGLELSRRLGRRR